MNFIKRIVAGPGRQDLRSIEGHVIRNGKRREGLLHPPVPRRLGVQLPESIRIPPGHWFMMGDNRGESDDSRFWGPVPTSWIIGGAFATYWPPDRIGIF